MLRDLQSCNLDGEWRALTHDRSEWRNRVRIGTSNLNQQKEADEKYRKDEQKRRREARQTTSVLALHCDEVRLWIHCPDPSRSCQLPETEARPIFNRPVQALSPDFQPTRPPQPQAITAPNLQHSYSDPGLHHSSWNESSKRKERCVCVCMCNINPHVVHMWSIAG